MKTKSKHPSTSEQKSFLDRQKIKVLDLHGRVKAEVENLVDHFLLIESRKKTSHVAIMTGKGKGIVQKTVIDYLKKSHYPWSFEKLPNGKPNEGVLIVYLD